MRDIYLLDSDTSQFRSLVMPDDDRFMELIGQFDGTPIGKAWRLFSVDYEDDSISLSRGDFPSLALPHIPVFSARAAEVLRPLLTSSGELLPIKCEDEEYLAFNVTVLVDALNVNASDILRFPSGRIMDVKTYIIDAERLNSCAIFKLPETALMDVFVSDEFLKLVDDAKLHGFSFRQVEVR
jgi:hypothetical protein